MHSLAWIEHVLEAAPIPLQRGERVPVCLPVVVTGYGEETFQTHTFTIDFSTDGCCFYLPRRTTPGDMVFIGMAANEAREIAPEARSLYRIAWVQRDGDGWVTGAKRVP